MLLWDSYSQGMYASFAPAAMEYTRSWRTGVLVGRIRVWFSPTRAATKHVTDLDGVPSVLWILRHVRRPRKHSSRGQHVPLGFSLGFRLWN